MKFAILISLVAAAALASDTHGEATLRGAENQTSLSVRNDDDDKITLCMANQKLLSDRQARL